MPLNLVAKQKCLRGLKCAYTGREVEVRMIEDTNGNTWFFSSDAYDPALDTHPDSVSLFSALSCRDGIRGAARDGAELTCPYTGTHLRPVREASGYRAEGGFIPSAPVNSPEAFARAMLMRNGVVPKNAPKLKPRKARNVAARPLEETERPAAEPGFADIADIADEAADRITHIPRTTIVNPGMSKED